MQGNLHKFNLSDNFRHSSQKNNYRLYYDDKKYRLNKPDNVKCAPWGNRKQLKSF